MLASLPELPTNAVYLRTDACNSTWGALGAVMNELPLDRFQYYMVVDSSVRGPYIPPYAQHVSPERAQLGAPAVGLFEHLLCGVATGAAMPRIGTGLDPDS